MRLITAVFFSAACFFARCAPASAENSITMNVSAQNVTDEKEEKTPIRQDLPREVKKEDVLDAGGMTIRYDEEKGIYYLYAEADLEPKSGKSFTIVLRDLWKVPDSDFTFLKEQADQRLENQKGKDTYVSAQNFRNKIVTRIDEIKAAQDAQGADTEKRIDLYKTSVQELAEIRQKVGVNDDFMKEADRFAEFQKSSKFIKFVIEAKNPSDSEPADNIEVTRYLPRGVQPEQITEAQGFEVKYDPDKSLYFLTKNVDFKAGESKKFEIILSDIWYINEAKLDDLSATEKYTARLANTNYEKLGAYLALEIKKYAAEIKDTQKKADSPEDKVATYAENLKKLDRINADMEQLKRLVDAADKAKEKKISEVIKTVTPDVATTWKLIYATIAFLVVVALSFYFLWWGQIKAKQNQRIDVVDTKKDK